MPIINLLAGAKSYGFGLSAGFTASPSFSGSATVFTQGSTSWPQGAVIGALGSNVIAVGGNGNIYKYLENNAWKDAPVANPNSLGPTTITGDSTVNIWVGGWNESSGINNTYRTTSIGTAWTAGANYPINIVASGGGFGGSASTSSVKYIVVGGYITGDPPINSVYSTNSTVSSWTTETTYPIILRSNYACWWAGTNRVHQIGGYGVGYRAEHYSYNGTTWTQETQCPAPNGDNGVAGVSASLLLNFNSTKDMGQINTSPPIQDVKLYKFNGSTWSQSTKQLSQTLGPHDSFNRVIPVGDYIFAGTTFSTSFKYEYIQKSQFS